MQKKSKNLFIQVTENDIQKVSLTFPIFTLKLLSDVMPEKVKALIIKRRIDVEGMIKVAEKSDFAPQTIFELKEKEKVVKVWIA